MEKIWIRDGKNLDPKWKKFGSGIGKNSDPRWSKFVSEKNSDPGKKKISDAQHRAPSLLLVGHYHWLYPSRRQRWSYFRGLRNNILGKKLNSLMQIQDPEWKKFGSGMEKITDLILLVISGELLLIIRLIHLCPGVCPGGAGRGGGRRSAPPPPAPAAHPTLPTGFHAPLQPSTLPFQPSRNGEFSWKVPSGQIRSTSVLRIDDILVWIRIRGSTMSLTNASGSEFGSGCFYFHHWPSRRQQKTKLKKCFSAYYFLKVL